MLLGLIHALFPDVAATVSTAQLTAQNHIEFIHLLLRPFDTRTHHHGRKTCLERRDRILNDREVHERDFPDVLVQIPFEYALSALKI